MSKAKKLSVVFLSIVIIFSASPLTAYSAVRKSDTCTCIIKCKDGNADTQCPVCSTVGADLDNCKGRESWTEKGGTAITTADLLQKAINQCSTGSIALNYYYPLENDIAVNSAPIEVADGIDAVIDLNGHRLDFTSFGAFLIQGRLTVTDTVGGGTITSYPTAAATIDSGGYFLMTGGTIEDSPNAVSISRGATFEMTGGTIQNQKRKANGSNIYNNGGNVIIREGAVIKCCDNSNCGHSDYGIRLRSSYTDDDTGIFYSSKMYLNGGIISDRILIEEGATLTADSNADTNTTHITKAVNNSGTIEAGKFEGEVTNTETGTIKGGIYDCSVENNGTISDGIFNGNVVNNGIITGGIFYGDVTGDGTIADSACVTVNFDTDGGSAVTSQKILRGQKALKPSTPEKADCTFNEWKLNGNTYNFNSAVIGNITLKANWYQNGLRITCDSDLKDGKDYTYTQGVLTVKTTKAVTIQNVDKSKPTSDIILVAKDISANITLDGVNIDVSDTGWKTDDNYEDGKAAFEIEDGDGDVTLTLARKSTNILKSGMFSAALQKNTVNGNGKLTIDGTGSLECTGGSEGAGIGGATNRNSENITVKSGTITAYGGTCAAGIGGGFYGNAENITIEGGTVTATGGSHKKDVAGGAGIGAGDMKTGKNITISGGIVTATGGSGAPAIGGGANIGTSLQISITGGLVKAIGGKDANAFTIAPTLNESSNQTVSVGDDFENLTEVAKPANETYTKNKAVKIDDGVTGKEIIEVKIAWTSMNYTYTDGEWNAETHSYNDEKWETDGGRITVENTGNTDITATFTYSLSASGITGEFTKQSITVLTAESDSTALSLSGKPSEDMNNSTLGTITAKIQKCTQTE